MTLLPYGCFGLCNDFKRHLKTHLLAVLMTSMTQRLVGLIPPPQTSHMAEGVKGEGNGAGYPPPQPTRGSGGAS